MVKGHLLPFSGEAAVRVMIFEFETLNATDTAILLHIHLEFQPNGLLSLATFLYVPSVLS
jgi:hypothetical protein